MIIVRRKVLSVILLVLLACSVEVVACAQSALQPGGGVDVADPPSSTTPGESSSRGRTPTDLSPSSANLGDDAGSASAANMYIVSPPPKAQTGVDWGHLVASSLGFLAVSHTFRYSTEATTRRQLDKPFFPGYFASVSNLHGWADGDPFLVNYVGHPMQGAVSGFMWQHDDRAYRTVEFGRNRRYWKEKMRGMAFAYVYSVQFEIGPISEASIGHIQSFYPQLGFVDHVITPTVGTGWAIAEDAIDRMIIQRVEEKVANPWVRLAFRSTLNPARSFANVMGGNLPWHRDDRPGVFKPFPESALWAAENARRVESKPVNPPPGVPPFDFTFHATFIDYVDSGKAGPCMGGGGTAGFRLASEWQMVLDVSGCKMLDFRENWSGDSLTYMVGPRWTPETSGHWSPHLQALVGGTKVTQEYNNPILEAQVANWHTVNDEGRAAKHNYYNTDWESAGFRVAAGAGVDYKFNNALALRLANLEYAHSWTNDLNGFNYHNAVQLSGGLVLRMGTW
ncbi:MAG: hypothetical protein WA655_24325 [Candidatus Korobacteraceae bacterium]